MKDYEKVRLEVGREYKDEIQALHRDIFELEKKFQELKPKHEESVKLYTKERNKHLRESNNSPFTVRGSSVNSLSSLYSSAVGKILAQSMEIGKIFGVEHND